MNQIDRFNNLTEESQTKILDHFRDWNVYEDWHEDTYAIFKSDMEEKGIGVRNISYSGFYSQGDGASFTGRIDEWEKLFSTHTTELADYTCFNIPFIRETLSCEITRSGHYYHAYTMSVSLEYDDPIPSEYEDCPLRYATCEELIDECNKKYLDFEKAIQDIVQGYAKKLYEDLENEYDHLTSDEQILENLTENHEETLEEKLHEYELAEAGEDDVPEPEELPEAVGA